MSKYLAVLLILLLSVKITQSQIVPQLRLSAKSPESSQSAQSFASAALALFPINPLLMIEGGKFYAGITKEVSLGFFPYGRVAGEYSLIFRSTKVNHLRFSYNYDIGLETRDLGALLMSFGGGYFTDFDKEGFFPQASVSLLFPIAENIASNPYIKIRHTFMTSEEKDDITDLSFGFGLYISL